MKLSIIIPVMNNWVYTKYTLEHLKNLDSNFEIIIIDNNSVDETKVFLPIYTNKFPNIKSIKNNTNTGFGYACNQGYQIAQGEIVLFLNNDIKFEDKSLSFLNKLVEDISSISEDTLFGPTGGFVDPNDQFNFKYETEDTSKIINYMSGWFLVAKKSTFDKLIVGKNKGPFDAETYFVYYEDTDLGLEAIKKKIKFKLYPVPVIHLGKKTSRTINVNKLYTESRIKFLKKWKHLLTTNE